MKRPNVVVYLVLGFILKVFSIFKGQKITEKVKLTKPSIILSNHTSFYDFVYTTSAVYPNRINYLAASKMFYEPKLGFFLRLARAIPKALFQSDPNAVTKAYRILDKKGIIGIFPEGQISPIGKSLKPPFAIAKLLRKAGVDVYTIIHHNAYFVNPPWSKKTFRGKIETEVRLLKTKDEIIKMTDREIYDLIEKSIYFNASEFNKEKKYTYKVNDITNLDHLIYECPICKHDGLRVEDKHLICPDCGHEMHYDKYGMIGNMAIDELYEAQARTIQKAILADPEYMLKRYVKLEEIIDKKIIETGYGILSLDRKKYHFHGYINEEETTFTFDVKNVSTLPSDIGRNIQIYENDRLYQFKFDIINASAMFVHAGEFMHELYLKSLK